MSEFDESPESRIIGLFATPVARITHPAAERFNAGLASLLIERAERAPKEFGYKVETAANMLTWREPVIDKLTGWALGHARTYVLHAAAAQITALHTSGARPAITVRAGSGWASIYRKGDQHAPHYHPNTAITAIYYVASPDTCSLDLIDPRPNIDYYNPGITFGGEANGMRLTCAVGELILFPGWLRHSVPTFDGDGERISMSWNIDIALSETGADANR